MHAISLPQPLASQIVFRHLEVINFQTRPRRKLETLVIHAHESRQPAEDQVPGGNWYIDRASELIGCVEVATVATPESVDLIGARGPWCVVVRHPQVFPEPITCLGVRKHTLWRLEDPHLVQVEQAIATAETPGDAAIRLRRNDMKGANPRPGRWGWTGD